MSRETVKVDLHGHSSFSDGAWDPERIARACADAGVRYAALTDHNTLGGVDRFEAACGRHGVGVISGLELLAFHGKREIHLLCYGFDRTRADLEALAKAARETPLLNSAAQALFEKKKIPELIRTVHEAGGIVLLAHPLVTEPDFTAAEGLVADLKRAGLDGIEAYHADATPEQRAFLRQLAERHGLVMSGGTDHHGPAGGRDPVLGISLPARDWEAFRDRLLQARKQARHPDQALPAGSRPEKPEHPSSGRVRMFVSMALPAISVIFLFTLTLFAFFLPRYEKGLMDRKREMIRELTSTVWSMLAEAEKNVKAGLLSPAEARSQMIERVRALRYGSEGKDYFWLQDLSPRMLVHPYRPDLEGTDLSGYKDGRGVPIFTVFADTVRRGGDGYVAYVWQWKDDPSRVEAKESYIRLFEPWGWVIGTGLYIHDVVNEIRALKRNLLIVMGGVVAALVLLLLAMLRSGVKADRMREAAERRLQESNERYRSLARASAEGVLFVRNFRCVYANPVFLEFAGCDADDLALLDWRELFPELAARGPLFLEAADVYADALLRRRDGTDLRCRVAHKTVSEQGSGAFMVLVRRPEETGDRLPAKGDGLFKRLLNLPSAAAEDIAREITLAETDEQVEEHCRRVQGLVGALLESGTSPSAIAGMVTAVTDSATSRFIDLAQADSGPAPAAFAFVALGSQGRGEQTLFTDQDNALIYAYPGEGREAEADRYFSALAARVCLALTRSGYRNCKGLVMASNPRWCQPLAVWKGYFTNWISKAEEHDMMEFGTFFDLRCVKGDDALVQALRAHIRNEISQSPQFFTQAARNALLFKSPLRLFGALVSAGGVKDKSGHLDLKAVMMPIVTFARLYALHRNVSSTSTTERLSALSDTGLLLPSQHHDILTAFETLLRLRLRHQSMTIQKGGEADNLIDPSWLGHIDEAVLKECFKEIDLIQDRINRDFLGGQTSI